MSVDKIGQLPPLPIIGAQPTQPTETPADKPASNVAVVTTTPSGTTQNLSDILLRIWAIVLVVVVTAIFGYIFFTDPGKKLISTSPTNSALDATGGIVPTTSRAVLYSELTEEQVWEYFETDTSKLVNSIKGKDLFPDFEL